MPRASKAGVLLLRAKVKQHVPAQDDVELAGMRRGLQQIMYPEPKRFASASTAPPASKSSNQRTVCVMASPR